MEGSPGRQRRRASTNQRHAYTLITHRPVTIVQWLLRVSSKQRRRYATSPYASAESPGSGGRVSLQLPPAMQSPPSLL